MALALIVVTPSDPNGGHASASATTRVLLPVYVKL